MPVVARVLPVPVPEPVLLGSPSPGLFAAAWSVVRWVEGEPGRGGIDPGRRSSRRSCARCAASTSADCLPAGPTDRRGGRCRPSATSIAALGRGRPSRGRGRLGPRARRAALGRRPGRDARRPAPAEPRRAGRPAGRGARLGRRGRGRSGERPGAGVVLPPRCRTAPVPRAARARRRHLGTGARHRARAGGGRDPLLRRTNPAFAAPVPRDADGGARRRRGERLDARRCESTP